MEVLKGWGDVATAKTYFAQNECDPFGHSQSPALLELLDVRALMEFKPPTVSKRLPTLTTDVWLFSSMDAEVPG